MTFSSKHCGAYVGKGQPLARGGRRFRGCKRAAITTRQITEASLNWQADREVALCGQHAAQFDKAERGEGFAPRLESDEGRC